MMKPINESSYLTKEQIERIYDVYEFEEGEEITSAWYENNRLYIEYWSEDGCLAVYEPYISSFVDKKIIYILEGK